MARVANDPSRRAPVAYFIGDVLRLRKPHPCGGYEWTVVRLGADIGLTCNACGRRVLLPRREVERRTRHFVSRGPGFEAARSLVSEGDAGATASGSQPPTSVMSDDVVAEPDGY